MQRLVYAPKVQAYVRTDEGIVDLTDFIVSGSVTRAIDSVSTAEIVIQNPDKRFTKPGEPTFRPMDGITIFLSRFRQYPVQVFTGYLDTTPYLQLHPGTATLKASCTLKRLMYTYWDPGIPFTRDFLSNPEYGWKIDPQTGMMMNPPKKTDSDAPPALTDGSIGKLLYAVLTEAGNWDKDQILIEKLPPTLMDTVRDLYTGLRKNDEQLEKEMQRFLEEMIGPYGGGTGAGVGSGTNTGTGTTGSADISEAPAALRNFPRQTTYSESELRNLCEAAGFPDPGYAAWVSYCESSGNTKATSGLNAECCHGLWQLYLGNSPVDNTIFAPGDKGLANAQDPIISTWYVSQHINSTGDWTPWDCATGAR